MTDRRPSIHSARCRCPRCRGPIVIRRNPPGRPRPFLWVVVAACIFWAAFALLRWSLA